MGSREIVDIKVRGWLAFWNKINNTTYRFTLKIIREVELANFVNIQIGASYFPEPAEVILTMEAIHNNLPQFLPAGSQVPYRRLDSLYTVPVDLYLDYWESVPYTDYESYIVSGTVVPWVNTTYQYITIIYRTEEGLLSPIPDTMPNTEREPVGEGAFFNPLTSQYVEDIREAAVMSSSASVGVSQWAFAWEDLDLGSHIMTSYTEYHPFIEEPCVFRPSKLTYIPYNSNKRGYSFRSVGYTGEDHLEVTLYRSPIPARGYPRPSSTTPLGGAFIPPWVSGWTLIPFITGGFGFSDSLDTFAPWIRDKEEVE